jgi:hypothetical protein
MLSGVRVAIVGLGVLGCGTVIAQPQRAEPGRQDQNYTARDLLPLREHSQHMRFIEGDHEGDLATLTLRPVGDRLWRLEVDDMRRKLIGLNSRGDIVLLEEELPSEGYGFRYNPPPVIIPANVEPGTRQRQRGEVRIYDLGSGELETTSEYEHTLFVRGMRLVPADNGRMRAVVITTVRSADLGRADVETEIENAYHPGVGRIYQRSVTDVRGGPFNLFGETTVHTMRYSGRNREPAGRSR